MRESRWGSCPTPTCILGASVTTIGGFEATEIDFHVTGAVGTVLLIAEQYSLYDIYYIDKDTLYFGSESSSHSAKGY
jgi:ribosome biogenesis SPOUT family RNA methylase Rps3